MQKINRILDELHQEILNIKSHEDRAFSLDAFQGHKKRYEDALQIIIQAKRGSSILDIGSSPYHLLFCLNKLGFRAEGVDGKVVLKQFLKKYKLKVKECDIEHQKLPFKDSSFDWIIFTEVFEHLGADPLFVISEIRRVLKSNGRVLFTTPNFYALHKIIMYGTGLSFNDPYKEFEKVKNTGYMGHIREYSSREIRSIVLSSGFKIEAMFYKKYGNIFLSPKLVKNSPFIILGWLMEQVTLLFSSLRPTQVIILSKKNK